VKSQYCRKRERERERDMEDNSTDMDRKLAILLGKKVKLGSLFYSSYKNRSSLTKVTKPRSKTVNCGRNVEADIYDCIYLLIL
jgi:hypothetical protein